MITSDFSLIEIEVLAIGAIILLLWIVIVQPTWSIGQSLIIGVHLLIGIDVRRDELGSLLI